MRDITLLSTLLHCLAAVGLLLFIAGSVSSVLTARSTNHATRAPSDAVEPQGHTLVTISQPLCSDYIGRLPSHIWLHTVTSNPGHGVLSSVFDNLFTHYGILPSKWRTPEELGIIKHWKRAQVPSVTGSLLSAVVKLQQATDQPFIAITSHSYHADELQELLQQPVLRFTSVKQDHAAAAVRQVEVTDPHDVFHFDDSVDSYSSGPYDFVFVEERMNQALVVFMLEFGLLLEDIVYLNTISTSSDTSSRAAPPSNPLTTRTHNITNISMNGEDSFWHKANRQLDRRIAKLQQRCGPDTVSSALQLFEQVLHQIRLECSDVTHWARAQWWTAGGTGRDSSTTPAGGLCGVRNKGVLCAQQQQQQLLVRRCARQVTRQLMTQQQQLPPET